MISYSIAQENYKTVGKYVDQIEDIHPCYLNLIYYQDIKVKGSKAGFREIAA